MNDLLTIENVKAEHERLYSTVLNSRPPLTNDSPAFEPFLKEVDSLLADMTTLSAQEITLDDYTWLTDAVKNWRLVFASRFNAPKDIKLSPLPKQIKPTQLTRVYTEKELSAQITARAREFSKQRKMSELFREVNRFFEKYPSTNAETEHDWFNAELDFASQVLCGEISFTRELTSRSYWRLETKWLREVKRLKAYHKWEDEGGKVSAGQDKKHYYEVCREIRDMLVNPEIKASAKEFAEAKAYLQTRYLDKAGKIDRKKYEADYLLKSKASRVWESTGVSDDDRNYFSGERYVRDFYENIIPAIVDEDEEKTLIVLKAFQFSKAPENRYLLINCFETALAIYFLNPAIIEKLWRDAEGKDYPATWANSSVMMPTWPVNFVVPENCRRRLQFDGSEISFEGVMTVEQKEALLKNVTQKKHAEAIETLFQKSRLLPRMMTL
jgi:hypothetical protein